MWDFCKDPNTHIEAVLFCFCLGHWKWFVTNHVCKHIHGLHWNKQWLMCFFGADGWLLCHLTVSALSSRKDEECYGKCSTFNVTEVPAVQGALRGEPGEWVLLKTYCLWSFIDYTTQEQLKGQGLILIQNLFWRTMMENADQWQKNLTS